MQFKDILLYIKYNYKNSHICFKILRKTFFAIYVNITWNTLVINFVGNLIFQITT